MTTRIEDAVVAITGASSGIGRAAALRFAAQGAKLVLVARRERALRALCDECRRRGGQAIAMAVDVADEAALGLLVERAVGTYGRIDAWINNAAVMMVGKFEDCPAEAYRRVIETNLFGYINGARAVLPQFRLQGRGTLINVASLGGRVGVPYQSAYSARASSRSSGGPTACGGSSRSTAPRASMSAPSCRPTSTRRCCVKPRTSAGAVCNRWARSPVRRRSPARWSARSGTRVVKSSSAPRRG